jgi:hypothetical protein
MKKRGQAALEFLSTYGFAFLIILVMIGALSYFGVLNPSNFLPDRCSMSNLRCEQFQLTSDGTTIDFSAEIQNTAGETITVVGTDWRMRSNYTGAQDCIEPAVATNYGPGESFVIECQITSGDATSWPAAGDKATFTVIGQYKPIGASLKQYTSGDVVATIQDLS